VPGTPRPNRTLPVTMLLAALLGALAGARPVDAAHADAPAPFAASAATRYQVTLAARDCPSYADVMANRGFDDSADSPARPGRPSAYQPGQAVDPTVESANSPGCRPITGWRFSFGSSHRRSGGLSVVGGATRTTPPTAPETPRLDPTGRSTGGAIPGAVTVTLTEAELDLVSRRQLWVQGGTPADPLPSGEPAGKGFGFGALRCGIDGRLGANVQWIGFPDGVRHVFCFAYYVRDTARAGTLVVRVRPTRPLGYPQRFAFTSNASYAAEGRFAVATAADPVDATFVRLPASEPYTVQARLPDGWRLAELTCAASRPGGTATSTAGADPGTASASVALAAGDTVTCTFSIEPPPAPPGLSVRVFSDGGGATFAIGVEGAGSTLPLTAGPAGDGSAAPATGSDLTALPAGRYTVAVTPPAADSALWTLSGAACAGADVGVDGLTAAVTVAAGVPLECVLRMTRRTGSLRLRLSTTGGVATGGFAVAPSDEPGTTWSVTADTAAPASPTDAAGDLPARLAFRGYDVTALAPRTTADGGWQLTALSCTGGATATGFEIAVQLTAASPEAVCTAAYRFVPATRLRIVLRAGGSPRARDGPAVVEVSCVDGSAGLVALAANDFTEQTLPEPLAFLDTTSCTVTQTGTGVDREANVTTAAAVEPAPGSAPYALPLRLDIARDVAGYTVTVTDTFTTPVDDRRQATFLGPFKLLPVALIGSGMIGVGALLLLMLAARRRLT
jgi:hypothetical protein